MHWSAEEFVLVITSTLFLAAVASSFLPRVELTPVTRATFAIGAAAFIGAAALLARIEDVRFPVVLWLVPLVPIVAIAIVVRDARAFHHSIDAHAAAPLVRRASAFIPDSDAATAVRVLRERAANPRSSAHELEQLACLHAHLRPVVAANPSTTANVLAWLSTHGDPQIDAAIASRRSATSVATPVAGVRRVAPGADAGSQQAPALQDDARARTAVTVPSVLA